MIPFFLAAVFLGVSTIAFGSLAIMYRADVHRLRKELHVAKFDLGVAEIHRDAFARTYTDLKSRAYLRNARGQLGRASDILDA